MTKTDGNDLWKTLVCFDLKWSKIRLQVMNGGHGKKEYFISAVKSICSWATRCIISFMYTV